MRPAAAFEGTLVIRGVPGTLDARGAGQSYAAARAAAAGVSSRPTIIRSNFLT